MHLFLFTNSAQRELVSICTQIYTTAINFPCIITLPPPLLLTELKRYDNLKTSRRKKVILEISTRVVSKYRVIPCYVCAIAGLACRSPQDCESRSIPLHTQPAQIQLYFKLFTVNNVLYCTAYLEFQGLNAPLLGHQISFNLLPFLSVKISIFIIFENEPI